MNQKETIGHYDRLKPFIHRPEELEFPRREPSFPGESTSKSVPKPHSASPKHCICSQLLSDHIPPSLPTRIPSPDKFPAVFAPKLPSNDLLLLQVQNEHPRFPAEPLVAVHLASCLKFHRKHNFQLLFDTFDLSSFSENLSVRPDSPFSTNSIESLISNTTENLDFSATPEASAKVDSQLVCPRQLRSTTMLQRHAQPLHQLEKHLPSNLKSENTDQSKKT